MLVTCLALSLTFVAAVTDVWQHKIYNWNTYPGILAGLTIHALGSWLGKTASAQKPLTDSIGWIEVTDSLLGFLACGFLMLLCFVFFQVGGGDVKLMAMLGALLGFEQGIATLLWTLVLGGALGLIVLIWRVGLWTLLRHSARHVVSTLKLGMLPALTADERQALQPRLFLAPCALAAAAIVRFSLFESLPI